MRTKVLMISLLICLALPVQMIAQWLNPNDEIFKDYYRRSQLLGDLSVNNSFSIFPMDLEFSESIEDLYSPLRLGDENDLSFTSSRYSLLGREAELKILPFQFGFQYNSHHPEGINDGAMYPTKGIQLFSTGGFVFEWGALEIKFQPEVIHATNKNFEGFQFVYNGSFYESPYNTLIDLPERFGVDPFTKSTLGQSSIRLNVGSVSFGLSNENLWWGPGMRNSLIMTNTAPGFMHFTFNSRKAISTLLGSFEWQLIFGKLNGSKRIQGLRNEWRYINGLVITYKPKWIPGLFLGLTRTFTVYNDDLGRSLNDLLPVVIPFGKKAAGGGNEDSKGRDQIASVFFRWLFPESHLEIYAEYGREDHAWNTRDLIVQPNHTEAYIFGFRKLLPLKRSEFLSLLVELTHLEANPVTINRSGGSWYEHGSVEHGYTHEGQMLGAGIGPGSNLQTLDVSWVKQMSVVGVRFERYVHNNDFWYRAVKDIRANWVDLSITPYAYIPYKNFVIGMKMKFVKSFNYQWVYEPKLGDDSYFWEGEGWDVFNFQAKLNITYRF